MFGAVTGGIGLLICLRFLYYYLTGSGSGHLQSLILAAILLILSFNMFMLGVLSDVITANRKLLHQIHYSVMKGQTKKQVRRDMKAPPQAE